MANTLGSGGSFAAQNQPTQMPGAADVQGALQVGTVGGAVGVGGTRAQALPQAPENPLVGSILNLAGEYLKGKVKAAKTEAYVVGMQRAASGEALADIAAQQPWYATLFGDSDVVEGARWYASNTTASDILSGIEEDMPTLREMNPEQIQSEFSRRVQERLTGDAQTDAAILQSTSQTLPTAFKRHLKEHVGWQQERAAQAMSASVLSAGRVLQNTAAAAAKGTASPEDTQAAFLRFAGLMQRPKGMPLETYTTITTQAVQHMTREGNFHALTALETSGWVDALPQEVQDKITTAKGGALSRARAKFATENADDIARVHALAATMQPGDSAEKTIKPLIQVLQQKWYTQVGANEPYMSGEAEAALLSGAAVDARRAQAREQEKLWAAAQAQSDTARKEELMLNSVRGAVATGPGGLAFLRVQPGFSEDVLNRALAEDFSSLRDNPKAQVAAVDRYFVAASNIKPITEMTEGLTAQALARAEAGDPNGIAGLFEQYRLYRQRSPELAAAVTGKYARRFDSMYRQFELTGETSPGILASNFLSFQEQRAKLPTKEAKAALKALGKELAPKFQVFGIPVMTDMTPSSANFLLNEWDRDIEYWMGNKGVSLEAAIRMTAAQQMKRTDRIEVLGGHAWRNGTGQRSAGEWVLGYTGSDGKGFPVPADRLNEVFDAAIADKVFGGDVTKYGILRDEDAYVHIRRLKDAADGEPQWEVSALAKDGTQYPRTLVGAKHMATVWQKMSTKQAPPPSVAAPPQGAVLNPGAQSVRLVQPKQRQ